MAVDNEALINYLGIDRTEKGTGYACQYPTEMAKMYQDTDTCPEKLLLFFHRLRYDFKMKDGRSLLQRIYDDHFEGAEGAEGLLAAWEQMKDYLVTDMSVSQMTYLASEVLDYEFSQENVYVLENVTEICRIVKTALL